MLSGLLQDLSFAVRTLRRQPLVLIATILLLGLGIAACTVLFSAIDALLLRPLPVRAPDELVRFVTIRPVLGARGDFSYPFLRAARERFHTVVDIFGWQPFDLALTAPGPPERIRAHVSTGNFFQALGVPAAIGRVIEPADDQPSKAAVAMLSDGFWRRRFGADRGVLGRAITLNGHPFTVVGVLPAWFNDVSVETSPEVRVPLSAAPLVTGMDLNNQDLYLAFEIAGRLRPGATLPQARQELASLFRAVLEQDTSQGAAFEREQKIPTDVEPLSRGISTLRKQFGSALLALMTGAALLMILVCANVSGLLLARSAARTQEWSVRLAVGASRWRLARLMLAESVLLAFAGIAVGLLITVIALPLLEHAIPPLRDRAATSLPLALRFEIDWRVLLFASAAGLATAIGVGIAPAFAAARHDLHIALKAVRAARGTRVQSAIIALQVALCTVLLAGAGVLVQTFLELRHLDPGFDAQHVATFGVDPGLGAYTPAQTRNLLQRLLAGVRALPGVEMASIASRGLMRGTGMKMSVVHTGQRITPADFLNASTNAVSPEYFETMGMRFLAGRNFRDDEVAPKGEPQPRIVNQAFVERFFPDGRAIGERFGDDGSSVIIGVVSNAKYRSLREPLHPVVYGPWPPSEWRAGSFILHVRTRMRPQSIIAPVRAVLAGIDPRLPFFEITTLAEEVDRSVWQERMVAWMSLAFAVLAALLAGTGIYGLMSYVVAQRSREIGIRAALGARPSQIVTLVSRNSILLTLLGAAIGLTASVFAMQALKPLLFGATELRAPAILAIAAAVVGLAAASTLTPAARAARIDPAATLRAE
jgi:predicted permease